jgi:hypothetical protein
VRAEDQLKADEKDDVQEIVQGLDEGRDDERAEEEAVQDMPAAARHFRSVVATMHSVLAGVDMDLEPMAELSREQREAFEVLKQVVSARGRRGGFIYAEHRLERLNQVLAVLQPALSIGSVEGLDDVRSELASVVDEVAELRDRLIKLDAAEEEIEPRAEELAAEGDKDDDDDEDEDSAGEVPEPGAPPRPSTLAGAPAAPDKLPARTTLTGTPAAPELPVRPTTLVGTPEAPDFTTPPSTLGDDEGDGAVAAAATGGPSSASVSASASASSAGATADAGGKPARTRKAKQ